MYGAVGLQEEGQALASGSVPGEEPEEGEVCFAGI